MIRRVEALRYRSLRDVDQEVRPFQILVGPNASGKSTFLDVLHLIGDMLRDGLVSGLRRRSPDVSNIIWMKEGRHFEIAIELDIPADRRSRLTNGYERARYELDLGLDERSELSVLAETLWLRHSPTESIGQKKLFPESRQPRERLVLGEGKQAPKGWKKVVTKKIESGNDYFHSETTGWMNPFKLGRQRLALANLPEDEEKFPVATWVKGFLLEGVQLLVLNSESMRKPSPPGSPLEFQADGSNLPWAIHALQSTDHARFARWLQHVRTALPQIEGIETIEREEDKHRYVQIVYSNGLKAPSWTISDGTLRLLALTLVAYLDIPDRVFLIEEPENGIHPQAVETIYQALSEVRSSQILCATHSPVILSLAEPQDILCFALTKEGATDVVRGDRHPNLQEWKRSTDLGTLFAAGVLG
ncbi:MAG TPA: AAA family ATPase [Thermoanaerobaculia bacterium]|nr:AAA family ATPase [Thermoanaerobaculia bacterium]